MPVFKIYIAAAYAIADVVKEPNEDKIIPGPFDEGVAEGVAEAVAKAVSVTAVSD
ncbi:hypothetical protein [Rhodohalobacter barkolensis]|uniref:hypothetical protein n=1 Tax=Rhodohalobacter barkolensis TaxID=2053187 RepID=UPI0013FD1AD7|nr:hypothetical protein [Rhodohalobacter barkolensis]